MSFSYMFLLSSAADKLAIVWDKGVWNIGRAYLREVCHSTSRRI
jgi:hypothetical protein